MWTLGNSNSNTQSSLYTHTHTHVYVQPTHTHVYVQLTCTHTCKSSLHTLVCLEFTHIHVYVLAYLSVVLNSLPGSVLSALTVSGLVMQSTPEYLQPHAITGTYLYHFQSNLRKGEGGFHKHQHFLTVRCFGWGLSPKAVRRAQCSQPYQ